MAHVGVFGDITPRNNNRMEKSENEMNTEMICGFIGIMDIQDYDILGVLIVRMIVRSCQD